MLDVHLKRRQAVGGATRQVAVSLLCDDISVSQTLVKQLEAARSGSLKFRNDACAIMRKATYLGSVLG